MRNSAEASLVTVTVPPRAPPLAPPLTAASASDLLASFLHPLDTAAFLASYYRRRPVAVTGGGARRVVPLIDALLCGGDLRSLLEASPSDSISAWMRAPDGTIKSLRLDAAAALTAHECGASLYFRAPQGAADALVPAIAEACGHMPAALYADASQRTPRGEVELFASRAGHETGWHTDFQSNFTFQLSGVKRWRLKMPGGHGSMCPLRGVTPHFATSGGVVEEQAAMHALTRCRGDAPLSWSPPPSFFSSGEVCEVTLKPGDLLHFPAGAWHSVSCLEDSLSINVSLVGLSWADVAASAARHVMWRLGPATRGCAMVTGGGDSCAVGGAGAGAGAGAAPAPVKGASTQQQQSRKRQRQEAAVSCGVLPSSLATAAEGALDALRSAVALLRGVDLAPPALALSRRFSGLPGGDVPIEGGEEEEEEGRGEGSAMASSTSSSMRLVAPGVEARYEAGTLHISPAAPPTAAAAAAVTAGAFFELNPLCVILPLRDTLDDAGKGGEGGEGEDIFVLLINYGSVGAGAGGEDLVPLLRTILHTGGAAPARATVEAVMTAAGVGGAEVSQRRVRVPVGKLHAPTLRALAFAGAGTVEGE